MTEAARIVRIDGFRRTVSDLYRSVEFFEHALGFVAADDESVARVPEAEDAASNDAPARHQRLRLGDEHIELHSPIGFERHRGGVNPGEPVGAPAFQHIAIVTNDMPAAMARLLRFSPAAISDHGAVRLPTDSGGATAFKFRGPDGHPLELIAFADGGAGTRWHGRGSSSAPTIGIDHSAIDSADIEGSIAFYTSVLGLEVAHRHVNRGPAQDALDGVPGAIVEVVSLVVPGQDGFHVELLGYRTPAVPAASPGNGLLGDIGDRLTMRVHDRDDLDAIVDRWQAASCAVERLDERTALGRDPDGHLVLVRSPKPPPA